MVSFVKGIWVALLLGTFFTRSAKASTWTAASCSSSSVQTALNKAAAGDTIMIPAGSCTWTTQVSWTVASGSNSVTTLQGQTVCTGSGDPALNNLSCTDNTTITCNVSGGNPCLVITPPATGEARVTALTFGGAQKVYHGIVLFNGTSTNPGVRVDHCHFTGVTGGTGDLEFGGWIYGVVDHNIFYAITSDENEVRIYNGAYWNGSNDGYGHAAWGDSAYFGSNKAIYLEANYFYSISRAAYQLIEDCAQGGHFVARFNTIGYHMIPYTHGTTGSGGPYRGCRALEVYGNTSVWNAGNSADSNYTFMNMESGTGMVWGNDISGQNSILNEDNSRSLPTGYTQVAPPNGWGYCGSGNGGPSAWDKNLNSTTGYPCLDMPGRGKGDLLKGQFPTVCDSATGCSTYGGTWPAQAVEPYYAWANTYNSATRNYWTNTDSKPLMQNNRDYYFQCGPLNASCSSFTGAYGVGQGMLASKPSTCTTGVGWWATDQGSWNTSGNGFGNGVLYLCSATNTWTSSYTPYTYPHPLTQGTQQSPLPAPTSLTVTVE
jgi:hypothetical protein